VTYGLIAREIERYVVVVIVVVVVVVVVVVIVVVVVCFSWVAYVFISRLSDL